MRKALIKLPSGIGITASASVVGKLEGEGPLGSMFDECNEDMYFGQKSWEQAESELLRHTVELLLMKRKVAPTDVDLILSGDLLNQCTASAYALSGFGIPFFGLYGACSTAAEGLAIGSMLVAGQHFTRVVTAASSHFGSSERQFRFPVEYGGQRTPTAQRTVTGCGAFMLETSDKPPYISEALPGIITDFGVTDAGNMGAAMAPAAVDTIARFFAESDMTPADFDLIVTGDLATEGYEIACDLLKKRNIELAGRYSDCGMLIFDRDKQDVHSGASGCGCSASVLSAFLLDKLNSGANDILFIGTGALMSPMSVMQGLSIPCIAHAVHITNRR